MVQHFRQFEYSDFYDFVKKIDNKPVKRLLYSHMVKKCRVDINTVKQWVARQSIPFYQSDRVTECVILITIHLDIDPESISEKLLFPNYALQINNN